MIIISLTQTRIIKFIIFLLRLNLKSVSSAQYLTGNITYAKDELGNRSDIYPIKYFFHEKKHNCKGDKEKTKEEYKDNLRELKIQWLTKLG